MAPAKAGGKHLLGMGIGQAVPRIRDHALARGGVERGKPALAGDGDDGILRPPDRVHRRATPGDAGMKRGLILREDPGERARDESERASPRESATIPIDEMRLRVRYAKSAHPSEKCDTSPGNIAPLVMRRATHPMPMQSSVHARCGSVERSSWLVKNNQPIP